MSICVLVPFPNVSCCHLKVLLSNIINTKSPGPQSVWEITPQTSLGKVVTDAALLRMCKYFCCLSQETVLKCCGFFINLSVWYLRDIFWVEVKEWCTPGKVPARKNFNKADVLSLVCLALLGKYGVSNFPTLYYIFLIDKILAIRYCQNYTLQRLLKKGKCLANYKCTQYTSSFSSF